MGKRKRDADIPYGLSGSTQDKIEHEEATLSEAINDLDGQDLSIPKKKREKKDKRQRQQEREAKERAARATLDLNGTETEPELIHNETADALTQTALSELPTHDGRSLAIDEEVVIEIIPATTKPKIKKKKKKKEKSPSPDNSDTPAAHLSILSKFKRYQAIASDLLDETITNEDAVTTEVLQAEGLQPLPQPAIAPTSKYDPLSSLPKFLAQPTLVSSSNQLEFTSFNLSTRLLSRLSSLSFTEAFPVQAAIIPLLLEEPTISSPSQDLLVSASTGSGKTLSYLIPIIESLRTRVVTRIRALIIVPTRELVTQVQSTAEALASGSGLRIGTAIGTRAYASEIEQLVGTRNGVTGVDILIATPGRLVEHIRNTEGFTLEYLKLLVVDEADRLLGQSFQEWVDIVMAELDKPRSNNEGQKITINNTIIDLGDLGMRVPDTPQEIVRKIILSATMTRDVGKLAGLKLKRPRLVVVDSTESPVKNGDEVDDKDEIQEIQSLPPKLAEFYLPANSTTKPLLLHNLLNVKSMDNGVLIFTKSNESAARLGRLLELLTKSFHSEMSLAVCSGEMRKKEAAHNVTKFKKGEIKM